MYFSFAAADTNTTTTITTTTTTTTKKWSLLKSQDQSCRVVWLEYWTWNQVGLESDFEGLGLGLEGQELRLELGLARWGHGIGTLFHALYHWPHFPRSICAGQLSWDVTTTKKVLLKNCCCCCCYYYYYYYYYYNLGSISWAEVCTWRVVSLQTQLNWCR